MALLMKAVLLGLVICASSDVPLKLSLIGDGNVSNPTLGGYVVLNVSGGGENVKWVRIDRTDGIADTSPYVRIADEAASFLNAPHFPTWAQPNWGDFRFYFGGAPDNKPISIVASGWSDRYNGTCIAKNSTPLVVHYTPEYENADFNLVVTDLGPGSVRLSVASVNESMPPFDQVRFDRFVLADGMEANTASSLTAPAFQTSFFYHQESTGSIVLTFQQPGIYYYGATPSFRGREGGCTAGGVYDGNPSYHPTALVVAGPDGVVNDSLPAGFAGQVHHMQQLVDKRQFCIIHENITVFNGAKMFIPLCRPDPKVEIPHQPKFFTVVAPSWLDILPVSNQTTMTYTGGKSTPYTAEQISLIEITAPTGYVQRTFYQSSGRWSLYNDNVPVYFGIKDKDAANHLSPFNIWVSITDANVTTVLPDSQRGQLLFATLVQISKLGLKNPPSRLVTSITWSDSSFLMDGPVGATYGTSFLQLYRSLGFNNVPLVSAPGKLNHPWMYPGNRSGTLWSNLTFGPEVSGPVTSGGTDIASKTAPNSTMLPPTVRPTAIAEEMLKWKRAYDFHNATGQLDIAYDGAFFTEQATEFCKLVSMVKPEWVFMDDEQYGAGYSAWVGVVGQSQNALSRRLPGESLEDLAWRMINEVMGVWTSCVFQQSPGTQIGWYGTPFPDKLFSDNGISAQPSLYGPQHYLSEVVRVVRSSRWEQSPMSKGHPRHLIPWITSCTYGQMNAQQTFLSLLHIFCGGATGFSFFIDTCIDDPNKVLALARAIGFVTPFENILMDGVPIPPPSVTSSSNIAVWSGMTSDQWLNSNVKQKLTSSGSESLIAVSAANVDNSSWFTLTVNEIGSRFTIVDMISQSVIDSHMIGSVLNVTLPEQSGELFLLHVVSN